VKKDREKWSGFGRSNLLDEPAKIAHISRIFDSAYKSTTSIVVIDNIERIIDWVPISSGLINLIKGKPESIAIRAARAVLPLLGGP
jgi:hypothetical protein